MTAKKSTSILDQFEVLLVSVGLIFSAVVLMLCMPSILVFVQNQITVSASANELKIASTSANIVVSPTPTPIPKPTPSPVITMRNIDPPNFSALGVLAMDVKTGKILYGKGINTRLPIASTTKIMTALVGIETFGLDDVLVVPAQAMVGGSTMGLSVGEKITFRALLFGMMLNSGNDAAYTIAYNHPGGFSGFILAMNQKAKSIGLTNTNFANPAGLDEVLHYSSAFDLSKIAEMAQSNPILADVVSTKELKVTDTTETRTHYLKNLNILLNEPGVIGIKTGYTEQSGENLVGLIERNSHRVLTVVLNSADRFGETKALYTWVYQNFIWPDSHPELPVPTPQNSAQ